MVRHQRPQSKGWLKTIWEDSWTKAYGYLKIVSGSLLLGLHYLGTLVNNGDVKSALGMFNFPAYVCLGIALLGCITLLSMDHGDK